MNEQLQINHSQISSQLNFYSIEPEVRQTVKGTNYLVGGPGVVLIGQTASSLIQTKEFLAGFNPENQFTDYLKDPVDLSDPLRLIKFAGQCCYASFGPRRRTNTDVEAYIENIIKSGHGSVLEHAYFNFFVYGITRSLSHELVRHRPVNFSQLSQRFVSGSVLRFVERAENHQNPRLHRAFLRQIDRAAKEYHDRIEILLDIQKKKASKMLIAESTTDRRKKVQQLARDILPNNTETFLVFSANVRQLRHMISMRCSEHAETEIRELFWRVYRICNLLVGELFADFKPLLLDDGTMIVKTNYPKV